LLIIRLTKAASTDGPSGLLAACPNIEILYCKFVFFWGGAKCLLACFLSDNLHINIMTMILNKQC